MLLCRLASPAVRAVRPAGGLHVARVLERPCRGTFVDGPVAGSRMVARAPQDVLAICGGTLPEWTHTLVYGARFLFPFSLRRAWFKATALGQSRALHALRAAAAAEGGMAADPTERSDDRAANVGRLTRQKVRARFSESARGAVQGSMQPLTMLHA